VAGEITVAVVTDELSDDLETALELASEMGIDRVELRGVGGRRVPRVDPYWAHRIPELLQRYGMRVVAISPGLFKIPLPSGVPETYQVLRWQDMEEWDQEHRDRLRVDDHRTALLRESIAFATALGCTTIVVFGFVRSSREPVPPAAIRSILEDAAREAERAGVVLALENEHICWAADGGTTAALVREVASPALRINWDPANALVAGETPFPDGYASVRGLVHHVHVKDARRLPDCGYEWRVHGDVEWEGQLRALVEDGYRGSVAIETHVRPKVAGVRETLARIRRILG
jgi:sugar phosphate isomerase/epimerase